MAECEIIGTSLINSRLASSTVSSSAAIIHLSFGLHKNSGPLHQHWLLPGSDPFGSLDGISARLTDPGQ